MEKKKYVNIVEVARYLGRSKSTIYYFVSANKIPYIKYGKRLMFDLESVDKHVHNLEIEPKNWS